MHPVSNRHSDRLLHVSVTHDQVVSVIRSDVPDTAPIVGEVPFFLGINYLKAMKASLDGDVQLEVLSKDALTVLKRDFPDAVNMVCQNLWSQYDSGRGGKGEDDDDDVDELNLDKEKLLTKKRILESTNFRKEQQFLELYKAARSGEVDSVVALARQGANLNQTDYDGILYAPREILSRCTRVCVCHELTRTECAKHARTHSHIDGNAHQGARRCTWPARVGGTRLSKACSSLGQQQT